jgi:hypothetical protein
MALHSLTVADAAATFGVQRHLHKDCDSTTAAVQHLAFGVSTSVTGM